MSQEVHSWVLFPNDHKNYFGYVEESYNFPWTMDDCVPGWRYFETGARGEWHSEKYYSNLITNTICDILWLPRLKEYLVASK